MLSSWIKSEETRQWLSRGEQVCRKGLGLAVKCVQWSHCGNSVNLMTDGTARGGRAWSRLPQMLQRVTNEGTQTTQAGQGRDRLLFPHACKSGCFKLCAPY